MKKILLMLSIIFIANMSVAQNLEPKSFMFSSMGDFTNFPVATETGLPDISLPLFSVPTASPDFNLDLKLQYNLLSNINANITGGQFGSAWNLNIEATIAREVRGTTGSGNGNWKHPDGIYFQFNSVNRDLCDLYSYNFFGNTGKFYLKKVNGVIKAFLYESNSFVEIKVNHDSQISDFSSIEILDSVGRKFVFGYRANYSKNIYYTTRPKGDNNNGPLNPGLEPTNPGTAPVNDPKLGSEPELPGYVTTEHQATPFWTNLNISKIYDRFDNLIAEFNYETVTKKGGDGSF